VSFYIREPPLGCSCGKVCCSGGGGGSGGDVWLPNYVGSLSSVPSLTELLLSMLDL